MMTGWGVILKTTLKKGDNSELIKSGLNIWKLKWGYSDTCGNNRAEGDYGMVANHHLDEQAN